jgi:hypothetical protein
MVLLVLVGLSQHGFVKVSIGLSLEIRVIGLSFGKLPIINTARQVVWSLRLNSLMVLSIALDSQRRYF